MKIVGGLLLSVFCVGSVFSSEMEPEAFVLERTSDDILQKMTSEEYISRIKVLEDAYFELKDQKTEVENNLAIMERMYDEREEQHRQFLMGMIDDEQPKEESFK